MGNLAMSEYVGKLIVFKDLCYVSGCKYTIDVIDHPLNKQLGLLTIEVICGARKRDRAKVLLSHGAKEAIKNNVDIVIKFIERESKIPKIIVEQQETKNIVVLYILGSGFRGDVRIEKIENGRKLVEIGACQAWGCVIAGLIHLELNGYVIVCRSGRLYGSPKYLVLYNDDGDLKPIYVDDLSELFVD